MNLHDISSNTPTYSLTSDIIGFSGKSYKAKTSKSIEPFEFCTLIQSSSFKIIIYHKPAPSSFHEPQDAIGINLSNKSIQFALADGVTIVRGTFDNNSDELSHQLVTSLCTVRPEEKIDIINTVTAEFTAKGHLGASTLIYGEISEEGILHMLFIGDRKDRGTVFFLGGRKVTRFSPKTSGNVGERFIPGFIDHPLPDTFAILAASDGLYVPSVQIKPLIRQIKDQFALSSVIDAIHAYTNGSNDDQSLIIILKE